MRGGDNDTLRFVLQNIDVFCAVSLYFASDESKYMKGSKNALFLPQIPKSRPLKIPFRAVRGNKI